MRLSERNKQPVWYANYVLRTAVKDEYGNETGESAITYSNPVKAAWNVNVVESDAEVMMFGVQAVDTIVMVAEKDGFPLSETSILWWGVTPTIKADGTTDTAHNYRVIGIRPSLDTVKFYAQKVEVTQVVPQEPITEPASGGDGV